MNDMNSDRMVEISSSLIESLRLKFWKLKNYVGSISLEIECEYHEFKLIKPCLKYRRNKN